jgi:hypothetical protein
MTIFSTSCQCQCQFEKYPDRLVRKGVCGAFVKEPTPREILSDSWECAKGHHQKVSTEDKVDLLVSLFDKIEHLEAKVAALVFGSDPNA